MSSSIVHKIEYLNDLELTLLVSLTAGEHCMIATESASSETLVHALSSICQATFGLQSVLVHCNPDTTVHELNDDLLSISNHDRVTQALEDSSSELSALSTNMRRPSNHRLVSDESSDDKQQIADIAVLIDLDLASSNVQVQVIELLRTKRIFARSAMYTAPRAFMLIATLSRPDARLSHHLNDMMAMSYTCIADDLSIPAPNRGPILATTDVEELRKRTAHVRLTAEIDAYLHNIVLFMRMDRCVQGGVTSTATRQLRAISKALAPMHGIDFVTPSLVMLATRRVYRHRLILATAATERSLQWGSDAVAVKHLLKDITVSATIDDVIASVETPL